jgi:alpha-tubulin suppressor-like RCC1 family protein
MRKILGVTLAGALMACPGLEKGGGTGGAGGTSGGGTTSGGDHPRGSTPPVPLVFTSDSGATVHLESIEAGENFFDCGIASDQHVQCWGTDGSGQLGHPAAGTAPEPPRQVDLGRGQTVKAITAGEFHVCAILATDAVKCWGQNNHGQLGLGDTVDRGGQPNQMGDDLPALDFGPGLVARSITAGGYHTCAILSDDSLRCWGGASAGELGTDERRNEPVIDARQARSIFPAGVVPTQVACGSQHTCAIDNHGQVYCWGINIDGQLGTGNDASQYSPRAVDLGKDPRGVPYVARQIVAGGYHTCALLDDASVKCWGSNFDGELGIGSADDHFLSPQAVKLDGPARILAVKHGHSCALLEDDRLMCWGMATISRFNRIVGKTAPYHVTNLNGKRPRLIATSQEEACVVTDDATTYCLNDMQLYDFTF